MSAGGGNGFGQGAGIACLPGSRPSLVCGWAPTYQMLRPALACAAKVAGSPLTPWDLPACCGHVGERESMGSGLEVL